MFLGHTLTDPYDVPALLFLQLEVWIEHSKMELLQESKNIQVYLKKKKKLQHGWEGKHF